VITDQGLGFGNVAKIFLLFEKPFWKLDGRRVVAFGFVWNDSERKRVEADVSFDSEFKLLENHTFC